MEDITVGITGKDSSMTVTFTQEQYKVYLKVMEELTDEQMNELNVFQILDKVTEKMKE